MDVEFQAGRAAQLAGDAQTSSAIFAALVRQHPGDPDLRYWLASALMLLGDGEAAEQSLNDARTLQTLAAVAELDGDVARLKTDAAYANTIASQLYERGFVALASVVWGMAIAAGNMELEILGNYALALQHQGRVDEASDIYRVAAANFPGSGLHQFIVYAQLFCEDGEARHAAEARIWANLYVRAPAPAPHANPPLAGRKLRIGYVAPKFATSQLRQFITPVLESHDPAAVEVVLYPADAATETAWPAWIQVHPIGKLTGDEAAALIRRDRIDILNDCWGHTGESRLGVFARKPAPVQVAWINFFQTTGLPQMDYVLHATADDAPDLGDLFHEGIWGVAPAFTPFRPEPGRLPPAPTPAKATGMVTFGSFNHPAKLSPGAIGAWAAILRNRPQSRLLLKYRYFADPVLQRATRTVFAAHGVAPERLVFAGHTTGEDYFAAFPTVDLMLDAWPAPGSTTTLEALSNGVPVLAMVGETPSLGGFYARTILRNVGLPDLITTTPAAYIQRALELTEDLDALDSLRARVRPGFENGPICDEVGFTRRLEQAYQGMFERWAGQSVPRLVAAMGSR